MNLTLILGFVIVIIGLYGILIKRNIIKMIISFALIDTGIHIIIISLGFVKDKTAPILDSAVDVQNAANQVVDPVTQVMVLTAIVIGLAVTALMLSFAINLYRTKKTLIIDKFKESKW